MMNHRSGPLGEVCPYCGDPVNEGAKLCRSCNRPLRDARGCPFCGEAVFQSALKCRYCGSWLTEEELAKIRRRAEKQKTALAVDYKVTSSPIGAFLHTLSPTYIVYPPELHLSEGQVRSRTWKLFGLRVFDQKLSTRKVASVRFNKGIIWSSITLETHGGFLADLTVPALEHDEARKMVALIEGVIQEREVDGDLAEG